MRLMSSLYSWMSLSRSRPVSRCRRMSRIAWAWTSESSKALIREDLASAGLLEARMICTTRSMLSTAMRRPSRIWARFSHLSKSKRVRRMITSRRWSRKWRRTCFRDNSMGRAPTTAIMLMPKEVSSAVYLYRELMTISGMEPRLSSSTMRMPRRSDSSRRSVTFSILRSFTRPAIFSTREDLFKAKGISVMITDCLPRLFSSTVTSPRIFTVPRPVA